MDSSSQPSRRIPNLGHTLIFFSLTVLALLLSQVIVLAASGTHDTGRLATVISNPRIQLAAQTVTYLLTLGVSVLLFGALWRKPFFDGISWNSPTALRLSLRLVPLGLALGFVLQFAENHITLPKDLPIDQFFHSAPLVWYLTFFGTILGPLFEEVFFRGLLLPALAFALDLLSSARTREAAAAWETRTTPSRNSLIASALISSAAFALLHAAQLGFAWAAVGLLFPVSLVLCWVRVRTGSTAASTLVHGAYNLSVFLSLLWITSGYRHLDRAS